MRLHVARVDAKRQGLVRISSILVFSSKIVCLHHFFFSYNNLRKHLTGNLLEGEAGV